MRHSSRVHIAYGSPLCSGSMPGWMEHSRHEVRPAMLCVPHGILHSAPHQQYSITNYSTKRNADLEEREPCNQMHTLLEVHISHQACILGYTPELSPKSTIPEPRKNAGHFLFVCRIASVQEDHSHHSTPTRDTYTPSLSSRSRNNIYHY